uniref:Uncharacterized protein n=1 Tax=Candidatus Kentrum sp. LPFa TaxID=2126335 RepID=A0A450Y3W2_9GAMM|nr:MAG: hypothetical protein BECKLPF1236A_GA0070988_104561 [Candidatus Kentron sp. LPFa]VFK36205.1 MAG: hypothetical protein BECKLPF1236C_GA0070990_105221 [Candidatus Kentron sp. LPFa]
MKLYISKIFLAATMAIAIMFGSPSYVLAGCVEICAYLNCQIRQAEAYDCEALCGQGQCVDTGEYCCAMPVCLD